jgi:hypothetical protein
MRCGNYLCTSTSICIWYIYIYVCIMKTGEGEEEYEIGGRDVMHRRTITRGEESENDRDDDDDVDGDDFNESDVVVRDSNKEVMKRNKNVKSDEKTESMDTIDDDYLIMTENDGDDEKEEAKKKEKKEYGLERTVKNVRASEGSRLTTSTTSNDDKSLVAKKPSRPSLGFSTRGVPATELLSTVIGSLRKQSKALIDALAKGRDDAEDIFDKVSESIEETKIALDSIDVKSEEIRNGLREICASTYYVDRKKKS